MLQVVHLRPAVPTVTGKCAEKVVNVFVHLVFLGEKFRLEREVSEIFIKSHHIQYLENSSFPFISSVIITFRTVFLKVLVKSVTLKHTGG